MNDSEIVDLYFDRNEQATVETRNKYGSRLKGISQNIVQNILTAEECENDTYMQAWTLIPPNEPRTYLFAFLARIIRNISLNRCRDDHRLKRQSLITELSAELEECIPSPDYLQCKLESMELLEIINKFLETLPNEKRRLFVRRYWYGDSINSLAQSFGMTQSNVKTTMFRIRGTFREYLLKEGVEL